MDGRDKWAIWQGGPHLLLPQAATAYWEGAKPPSGGRVVQAKARFQDGPATDYERACDVDGLIGAIKIAEFDALVIGDEVPMSTLVEHPSGSLVVFVPMTWHTSEGFNSDSLQAIINVAGDRFADTGIRFEHSGGNVVLQPAVFDAEWQDDATPPMRRLEPGTYGVWSVDTEVEQGEFRAHWLRPAPRHAKADRVL